MTSRVAKNFSPIEPEIYLILFWFQSKDLLELKILELVPDLTLLGETFEEASELEIAHNHVMKQLQVWYILD